MPENQAPDAAWARPASTSEKGLCENHPGGRWQSPKSVKNLKSGAGKHETGTGKPERPQKSLKDLKRKTGNPERTTRKPERENKKYDAALSINAKKSKKFEV